MHHRERRQPAALCRIVVPKPLVEELRTGMSLIPARPLEPVELLQPLVRHSMKGRSQRTKLVPGAFARGGPEVLPHALRYLGDDPQLVSRAARRLHDLAQPLHAAFAVHDRTFAFTPRR